VWHTGIVDRAAVRMARSCVVRCTSALVTVVAVPRGTGTVMTVGIVVAGVTFVALGAGTVMTVGIVVAVLAVLVGVLGICAPGRDRQIVAAVSGGRQDDPGHHHDGRAQRHPEAQPPRRPAYQPDHVPTPGRCDRAPLRTV
jgi:hypothetical protein